MNKTYDLLIVGGGVVGLSIAWEMRRRGRTVCVVERDEPGQAASWAGAGMIPPGPQRACWPAATALEQLAGLSGELHPHWHELLLESTGIDNGFRHSGSLYLADSDELAEPLRAEVARWGELGIGVEAIDEPTLRKLEPQLTPQAMMVDVPQEAQIRNPRHLKALIAVCESANVRLIRQQEVVGFETRGERIVSAQTPDERLVADQICLTAGAWTGRLAEQLGLSLEIRPLRGQIALLRGSPGMLRRIVNVGPRYLVPRDDGRILVGSTVEDVGFRIETTEDDINELLDFARRTAPYLDDLPVERTWAGLRPAPADGLPYLGRLDDEQQSWENAWIAAGHFRAGLQLSPATAVMMADLLCGQTPDIPAAAFSPARHALRLER